MNPNTQMSPTRSYRDAPYRNATAHTLARGLGWLSIGLGLAEVARPRDVRQAAGLNSSDDLVRGYGARELLTGAALLTSSRPEPFVWARVAGDVLDIATVGAGAIGGRSAPRSATALLALLGITAIDVVCAMALRREARQQLDRAPVFYGDRSGFPRGVHEVRGMASVGGNARVPKPPVQVEDTRI